MPPCRAADARGVAARVLLLAVLALAAAACGGVDDGATAAAAAEPGPSAVAASDATGADAVVEIRTYQFTHPDLEVEPGAQVRWVNRDRILHTVTSGERTYNDAGVVTDTRLDDLFDFSLDGRSEDRNSATYTFDEPGTYHVLCTIHPGIDATVTVSG